MAWPVCQKVSPAQHNDFVDIFRTYSSYQTPHRSIGPCGIVVNHVVHDQISYLVDHFFTEPEPFHYFLGQEGTRPFMAVKSPIALHLFFSHVVWRCRGAGADSLNSGTGFVLSRVSMVCRRIV